MRVQDLIDRLEELPEDTIVVFVDRSGRDDQHFTVDFESGLGVELEDGKAFVDLNEIEVER